MKSKITVDQALKMLPAQGGHRDVEVLKRGSLIVEMYAPVGNDPQQPHNQDELYVVQRGSGTYRVGDELHKFGPGDVLFAPAGMPHRFEKFSPDFATWVVFYGVAGGEAPDKSVIKRVEKEPLSRNMLICGCEAAHQQLNAFLDKLDEAQATEPKDAAGWAVKDHLMHLVPWMNGIIEAVAGRSRAAGMGLTEKQFNGDFDRMNAIIFRREKRRSFFDARWQFETTYRNYMAMLMRMSNSDVSLPYNRFVKSSTQDRPIFGWLWSDGGSHFLEHLPWMRAIVAAKVPARKRKG